MAYGGPRIQLAESFRQVSLLIPHLGTLTKVSGDVQCRTIYQCCGSGSGIRCLFDPWIRDP
jgi:hypothetical protein